uniref:Elongator complex protein 6 n=1 Tax=Clastoptera arizonana TaxID=38151 RepID=A0A1B6CDG3_9HEMI
MSASLISSIGLEEQDFIDKFIFVSEEQNSDANFVVSSWIMKAIQEESNVVLLTLHNSFSHYQNVILKQGCNLTALQESDRLVVIEPMKNIVKSLMDQIEDELNFYELKGDNGLKHLFLNLENIIKTKWNNRKVYLIIDDTSDFLALGIQTKDLIIFLKYCLNLRNYYKNITIVVCSHFSQNNEQQQVLVNAMNHISDIRISVSGLKTGFSADVTGCIAISRKNILKQELWYKPNIFHFKLNDRHIKVFAIGSVIT